MYVVEAFSGKRVRVDHTDPQFQEDIRHHTNRFDCKHILKEIRLRKDAGGAIHAYNQCLKCGNSVGTALSRSKVGDELPDFDENLSKQWVDRQAQGYSEILQKHARISLKRDSAWHAKYNSYLKSESWKLRRAKVLKRANFVCEGCLDRKAVDVHHETYKNFGEEFLFQLRALCKECHDRIHTESDSNNWIEYSDEHVCNGCRWWEGTLIDARCVKFDMLVTEAMLPSGPCGPKQAEMEGLK